MAPTVAPYGSWKSPVTPATLVEAAVRLSDVQVAGDRVYWNEGRPAEAGRQVIVRLAPGQAPADAIPPGLSARSQVHEYGGRCYAVGDQTLVFSNWEDQRLWAIGGAGDAVPLDSPAAGAAGGPLRRPGHHGGRPLGDLRPRTPSRRWEGGQRSGGGCARSRRHRGGGTGVGQRPRFLCRSSSLP